MKLLILEKNELKKLQTIKKLKQKKRRDFRLFSFELNGFKKRQIVKKYLSIFKRILSVIVEFLLTGE